MIRFRPALAPVATTLILLLSASARAAEPPTLTLGEVLARVREANPEIREAQARAGAANVRATASGRLPEPMASVQQWNAPASRPWDVYEADTLMYGLEQTFPLPPKLRLRRRSEAASASTVTEERRRIETRTRADASRTFHEYWRATRELEVHLEHVELGTQILATAESQYAAGKGRQLDVLRASADLARLHADVAGIQQEISTAKAVLRALMDLPSGAPLATPVLGGPSDAPPALASLEKRLMAARPEIRAAQQSVASAAAARRLAGLETFVPDVMVGAEYWDNRGMDLRDGWAGMVRVSLPFFSLGRWDARRAATQDLVAAEAGREAVTNAAVSELSAAHARAMATREVLHRFTREILPISETSLEAARASYVSGSADFLDLLDASRSFLDARLSTDRARARYEQALADLELALGEPIRAPDSEGER